MDLYFQYDENLSQNPFFKKLQSDHKIILDTAPLENWVICIPRVATIYPDTLANPTFLLAHILIPNDELPQTHFTNLLGDDIKVDHKKLFFQDQSIRTGGESMSANSDKSFESMILFEELFYTKSLMKYRVWCIETPLIPGTSDGRPERKPIPDGIFVVRDVKDAVELIWGETDSKVVFRKLDNACKNFTKTYGKKVNGPSSGTSLSVLRGELEAVYSHCVHMLLFNKRLKEKCRQDAHFFKILRIAVETYLMSVLYEHIFDAITVATAEVGEYFNKTVRKWADCHMNDFNIEAKYMDVIAAVRSELLRIEEYATSVEKLGCLRRAINVTTHSNHRNLSADKLIPILSFVIIKSGLTHWTATLKFLQKFTFNELTDASELGADTFLVSTLDSAITFTSNINIIRDNEISSTPQSIFASKNEFMEYVFGQIQGDNEQELLRLFKRDENNIQIEDDSNGNNEDPDNNCLCHPLCNCNKCKSLIAESTLSVNIQNMHGISAIHVAAMHGLPRMINVLLALDADLTILDENNWTALHYAAAKGHQNVLLLLLHAGIDINTKTNEQFTALHLSCLNGHQGCVKALLYYAEHMRVMVDKNCTTKMGDTALHLAAKWGFTEIIDTLLEYGVRVDCANRAGHTASDYAHSSLVLEQLKNVFVFIDECDLNEIPVEAPLKPQPFRGCISEEVLNEQFQKKSMNDKVIKAIRNGDTKLAYHFLGYNEMETKKTMPCHPLCSCSNCSNKNQEESDSNNTDFQIEGINEFGSDGFAMIHAAIQVANREFVEFLLNHGASANRKTTQSNQTVIHLAVLTKNVEMLEMILTHINEHTLNVQDEAGNTALHLAVQSSNGKMVQAILRHEPLLTKLNNEQETAMDIARKSFFFYGINLLKMAESGAEESTL